MAGASGKADVNPFSEARPRLEAEKASKNRPEKATAGVGGIEVPRQGRCFW